MSEHFKHTSLLRPLIVGLAFSGLVAFATIGGVHSLAQRSSSLRESGAVEPFKVSQTSVEDGGTLRIEADLAVLERAGRDKSDVRVPLPAGDGVTARINLFESQAKGFFLAGPLESDEKLGEAGEGEAAFTVYEGHIVGRITRGNRVFLIGNRDAEGTHGIWELDQSSLPNDGQPVEVDPAKDGQVSLEGSSDAGEVVADTNEFVDVLLLYTPAARVRYGSTAAIEAEATGGINNGNLALTNSGSTHRYRIVHLAEYNYTESGSTNTDLSRLRAVNDGFIDEVHTLRDTYKADVVALLTNATDVCGLGYLMGPSSVSTAFRTSAFNITIATCANANLSLAHEIGHNIGLQHDRANSGTSSPSFDYAYGYRVPSLARTVMAYACDAATPCARRPIFSTPNRNFPDTTTAAGTVTDDTTRAMELTSVQAANFRDTACTYSVNQTSISVPYTGATGSIVMTTATGCAWNAVTSDTSVATFPGGSYSGGGALSYTVSANPGPTPRTVTLTMGGRAVSVTQEANNCTYALGSSTATVASAAGSHLLTVTAPSGCSWTASIQAGATPVSFQAVPSSLGPIPDSPNPGPQAPGEPLDIKFNVSGMTGFSQIEVSVTAAHTYVGDVEATLIAPNGTTHRVFGYTGATTSTSFGASSDLSATGGAYVFKDTATSSPGGGWWQAAAANAIVPAGDYRTTNSGGAGATSPMPATSINSSFASLADLNGEWTLRLTDGGSGDTGSVSAAVLRITPAPPSWITLQTTSGSGSGNVSYSVTQNTTGSPRTAAITAAGQDFFLIQSAQASAVSVSGAVRYYGGTNPMVPDAVVSANLGSITTFVTTGASGQFTFGGISPGTSFVVTPSKSGGVNGLNSLDASRVAQYAAGLLTLTPNQLIAADASGNGSVNSFDASRIAQTVVGIPNTGIAGSWKFSPASKSYTSISSSATGENFDAILVGDVTGNWSPTALAEGDGALLLMESMLLGDAGAAPLAMPRRRGITGDVISLPVSVGDVTNKGITAFDIELSYDPEVLEPIIEAPVNNLGTLSTNFTVVANPYVPGRLTVSAYGIVPISGDGTLVNLMFRVKGANGATTSLRFEKLLLNEDRLSIPDGIFTVGREVRSSGPTFGRRK